MLIFSFLVLNQVGHLVMEAAAKTNMKRVLLEMGGKSPLIIFADADSKYARCSLLHKISFGSVVKI
jgi:aldehyde dehydrogenase (NAD+)